MDPHRQQQQGHTSQGKAEPLEVDSPSQQRRPSEWPPRQRQQPALQLTMTAPHQATAAAADAVLALTKPPVQAPAVEKPAADAAAPLATAAVQRQEPAASNGPAVAVQTAEPQPRPLFASEEKVLAKESAQQQQQQPSASLSGGVVSAVEFGSAESSSRSVPVPSKAATTATITSISGRTPMNVDPPGQTPSAAAVDAPASSSMTKQKPSSPPSVGLPPERRQPAPRQQQQVSNGPQHQRMASSSATSISPLSAPRSTVTSEYAASTKRTLKQQLSREQPAQQQRRSLPMSQSQSQHNVPPQQTSAAVASQSQQHHTGAQPPSQQQQQKLPQQPRQLPQQQQHPVQPIQPQQQPQQPVAQQQASPPGGGMRELRVEDALLYLDDVKREFKDRPAIYNEFLAIMKDFRSQEDDTLGVIARVRKLFRGHNNLILGFNTFLPDGYKISLADLERNEAQLRASSEQAAMAGMPKGQAPARRSMPGAQGQQAPMQQQQQTSQQQTSQQQTSQPRPVQWARGPEVPRQQSQQAQKAASSPRVMAAPPQQQAPKQPPKASPQRAPVPQQQQQQQVGGQQHQAVEFDHAISYVTTIKRRFANNPSTYRAFLEILNTYQTEQCGIEEVLEQVTHLFRDHPDLLREFTCFLPEAGKEQAKERLHAAAAESERRLSQMSQYHGAAAAGHQKSSDMTTEDDARLAELETLVAYLTRTVGDTDNIANKARRFKSLRDAKEELEMILERRRVFQVVSENVKVQSFDCAVCSKTVSVPSLEDMRDHEFIKIPTDDDDLDLSEMTTTKVGMSLLCCCGKNVCMKCFADYVMNGCSLCGFADTDEDALRLLTLKHAEDGNAWAQFEAACRLMDLNKKKESSSAEEQKRREEEAWGWLQKATSQGHSAAAVMLARLANGTIPSTSLKLELQECRPYFEVAAGFGDKVSQGILGAMCDSSGDEVDAVKWNTLAVHQGLISAAYNLAASFEKGTGGLEVSLERAKYYFEMGAKDGYGPAQLRLAKVLFKLESDTVHIPGYSCTPRCLYWARQALANGDSDSVGVVDLWETFAKIECANNGCERVPSSRGCCGGCKAVWYCSKACQKEHWKDGHKLDCFSS